MPDSIPFGSFEELKRFKDSDGLADGTGLGGNNDVWLIFDPKPSSKSFSWLSTSDKECDGSTSSWLFCCVFSIFKNWLIFV